MQQAKQNKINEGSAGTKKLIKASAIGCVRAESTKRNGARGHVAMAAPR